MGKKNVKISEENKKYEIKFKQTFVTLFKTILSTIVMVGCLKCLSFVIPLNVTSRVASCGIAAIYALVGIGVYYVISQSLGLFEEIVGKNFLKKLFRRK